MEVTQEDAQWEEDKFRKRRWCTSEDALALIENRPVVEVFRQAVRDLESDTTRQT